MSNAACTSMGARRAWDDELAGVSNGVAVRPSRRTEGCSEDACCLFPARPLATRDGERQGGPPTGAVWATRAVRAARRSARARRASDMDATKRWDEDPRKEDFSAPLPGVPNVGYRVPAKPLRFELWGAHKDLLLPNLAFSLTAIPKLDR